MDMERMMQRARPHAVVVPYPCPGNINPALQLAKLLYQQGVYVTFVNTEHNHQRVAATEGAEALRGRDGFRFETIPDGLSAEERGAHDYGLSLSMAVSQRCAAPLRELIARLNCTAGVPPVTCVVPTFMMSFALDVARELGLQSMSLWGCSAGALMGHMKLPELRDKGYFPVKDETELEAIIDWIPGMPPIKLGDISGFLRRTDDPDSFGLRFNESETRNLAKAGAVILNTFDELESDVLSALRAEYPHVYTIGPLGSLLRHHHINNDATAGDSTSLNLWKKDTEFVPWLDAQEPNSVVYVNFGSHAVLTPEQMAEFAWGLATAGYPFLWAVRDSDVLAGLPPDFLSEVSGRCRLTTWCAQEHVLRHRAVGCFLTHNGWNSTCESIAAGVPMVCWPGFADQYTNSKYACEVWRVGTRLDDEVRRKQVARRVREVMQGENGVRGSAEMWKAKGEEAVCADGTSHDNMQQMVKAINIKATAS
ncbi:UDP-glycosyltransferase 85A5-like [Lolium perenne]|uniref:UDP-glycosyltransferase 85A5-like n=1 Tax=Lolium perenne TaxID=4522 RepID=UPI0021F5E792|nr:UDP-glycosyltransferase 85A5-like [Lolium perenne]